jgi:hypothetical protein
VLGIALDIIKPKEKSALESIHQENFRLCAGGVRKAKVILSY